MTRSISRALFAGASLFAMSLAVPAWAQDAPDSAPQEDEQPEIVVKGFRGSLASAINVKRNETGVVDVIKAEDIAAFPDLNLAESLQRIPGVAISREAGEGRQISVRGLGPDYTRVRLNGVEALATSGTSDSGGASGTNRSRGFDFNIFASELFNSLTVRKSASADVEEGSLGATVDLQTGRPFDYNKFTLVVSAQAGYNDLAQKADPRLALVVGNTWADDTFGVLVSVAYGERHIREDGFGTTRWDNGPSQGGFCSPLGYDTNPATAGVQSNPTAGGTQCGAGGPTRLISSPAFDAAYATAMQTTTFLPRIPSYNQFNQHDRRLGVTGSFQLRPAAGTVITLDLLYANLHADRDERSIQALGLSRNLAARGKPHTTVREFTVDGSGNILTATLDNVDVRTQSRALDQGTEFKQGTLSITHDFSDRFRVSALAGRAESDFQTKIDTTITFDRLDAQNYKLDFTANDRLPNLTYDFDPTLAASYTGNTGTSEVRLRPGYNKTKFDTIKLDAEYDLIDGLSIKIGADDRSAQFDSAEFRRVDETVIVPLTAQQIADFSQLTSDFGRGLNLPAGVARSWLSPDIDKYAAAQGIYSNSGIYAISSENNSSARGNTLSVNEHNRAAYAMASFKFDVAGMPVRGNVGVRYVRTEQSSSGYAVVNGGVQRVTVERAYENTLPSMNLAVDVTGKFIVRFAAAQTIARPSLAYLSPGGDVSIQGTNRTYTTGNPFIDPTKSTNLDLSFEWYPERGALYGVGFFYKDISTFVQTLRTTAPFNTLGLPDSLLANTTAVPTDEFAVTQPVNSPGGKLKGFEINVQQPFTFLPGFLKNFGVTANYTYVKSDIDYLTSATPGAAVVTATLVGLSKHSANGTLYYETDKFSIRGSVAYRSGFLTSVPGRNNNFVEGTNGSINYDARASYNLTPQIEISIEGINLTNQANDQYVDFSNRVNAYRVTGRQFYLGARFAF
jgi:TonB-dependent receptor